MKQAGPFDFAIVGGGIVGLASALALRQKFPSRSLILLEKEATLAAHQTGHNSGVIHAGLYYKPGSAKARLCTEGAATLIEFCRANEIAHEICGKVVVALNENELPRLDELFRRGSENGIRDLKRLSADELKTIEPNAAGIAALHVPSTGIVDYRAVAAKMGTLIQERGGEIRLGAKILAAKKTDSQITLETTTGEVSAIYVINCGGLESDRLADLLGAKPTVRIIPFRGEYFAIKPERKSLIRSLIYPVPDPAFPFLGVHFTRRIDGSVEAGPNAVLALKREGYQKGSFNVRDFAGLVSYPGFYRMAGRYFRTGFGELYRSWSKRAFVRALQRLVPAITEDDLVAGGSGVRAQAVRHDGLLVDDFQFLYQGHCLHVLNSPSPAATASLAIGRNIADELERNLTR